MVCTEVKPVRLATVIVAGLFVVGSTVFAQVAGVDLDAGPILELLEKAESGDPEAQYDFGLLRKDGAALVRENDAEAVHWFRLSASQGHAGAQFSLGFAYRNGEGVLQNDVEAVRWYRLAVAQGHARAQYNLALMYAIGEGVQENIERAYLWFNVAAVGLPVDLQDLAVTNRDVASERLTPEQRTRAQALAATCFNSNFTDCGEP
jgi:hypothetical protein